MIREIRPEDWPLLREVRLRALRDAPYAFLTTYEEAAAHPDELWQTRATPADSGTTFVLDAGDGFEGMVSVFAEEDPAVVFLVAMWVAPERRGSGAAAGLVGAVVDWARRRGAARVVLTVEAGNDRAAALYRKRGFEPVVTDVLPYEPPPDSTTMACAT